jgi:hypothetical protein
MVVLGLARCIFTVSTVSVLVLVGRPNADKLERTTAASGEPLATGTTRAAALRCSKPPRLDGVTYERSSAGRNA